MPRLFAVVFAALLVFVSAAVTARDTPEAKLAALPAAEQDDLTMVEGVAIGDLLNIREKASPVGMVKGRLPNGSLLRTHECELFSGYEWCRVDALEVEGLSGWAPARYLRGLDIKDAATGAIEDSARTAAAANAEASQPPPAEASAEQPEPAPEGQQVADVPVPTPSPLRARQAETDAAEAEIKDARLAAAEAERPEGAVPLPPGLETRFGDAPSAVSLSLAGASETAYFLALRNGGNAPAATALPPVAATAEPVLPELPDATAAAVEPAEPQSPASEPEAAVAEQPEPEEPVQVAAVIPAAEEIEGRADTMWSVPIPTPRPVRDGEIAAAREAPPSPAAPASAPAAPVLVAQADTRAVTQSLPVPDDADAVSEIPCARYVGQPMTRCVASIVRLGDNAADVTVAWPDGGKRVITFRDGAPVGSNSRQEFRADREGNLNLIRVGLSERFEIIDAVAFGD